MCVFLDACVSFVRCLDVRIASYRPISFVHTLSTCIITGNYCMVAVVAVVVAITTRTVPA